jgi:hypothetical protein
MTLEHGTFTLTPNVGKGLPLDAALYPRTAQITLRLGYKNQSVNAV